MQNTCKCCATHPRQHFHCHLECTQTEVLVNIDGVGCGKSKNKGIKIDRRWMVWVMNNQQGWEAAMEGGWGGRGGDDNDNEGVARSHLTSDNQQGRQWNTGGGERRKPK
jgi:hypothetical protein